MIQPVISGVVVTVRSESRTYKVREGVEKGVEKSFTQTVADVFAAGSGVASIRLRDQAEAKALAAKLEGKAVSFLLSEFSVEKGVGSYTAGDLKVSAS